MSEVSIPVDLFNPGQVFACLGLIEAADILLGGAAGGFQWDTGERDMFVLSADGTDDPVAAVLAFLAEADPKEVVPRGWSPPPKKTKSAEESESSEKNESMNGAASRVEEATFVASSAEEMSLPIAFGGGNQPRVLLSHWADGSSRDSFKLYSGNRSAFGIANAMLRGTTKKAKGKTSGAEDLETKGLRQLFREDRAALVAAPFHVLTPMRGSFNFDPRGAWTGLDAGYSPNDQGHQVLASPVVEILAAWGLEYARPEEIAERKIRYHVWRPSLPPLLARAVLAGARGVAETICFRFDLSLSGKNKVVTFATQEALS